MIDFFRKFGFTKRDLILVSFLLITLIAGLIIKESGWKQYKKIVYPESDAEFEQKLNAGYSRFELDEKQKEKLSFLQNYSDSLLNEKENNVTLKNGEIPSKKININNALTGDLQLIPGIGEVTAERIIDYREMNDGFKKIEEIMEVKGIGRKKFEKMKNLITVD